MATSNFYLFTSSGFGRLGHLQLFSYSISKFQLISPPETIIYQEVNDNDYIYFGFAALLNKS